MRKDLVPFFVLGLICLLFLGLFPFLRLSPRAYYINLAVLSFLYIFLFLRGGTLKNLPRVKIGPQDEPDFAEEEEAGEGTEHFPVPEENEKEPYSKENEGFHAIDLKIYKESFHGLFTSITNYLYSTGEPVSDSLAEIKTSIVQFLEKIEVQKNLFEGDEDSQTLKDSVDSMRTHISELTQSSTQSCASVAKEIEVLDEQMSGIINLITRISDVAERVHILSINASIEAARAGVHGRGFKIIAGEVQRLARETQSFVDTIGASLVGTREAFSSIYSFMETNKEMAEFYVKEDSTTYRTISEKVDQQLEIVLTIYSAVLAFVDSLQRDMDVFVPLGMQNAIVTQEIENLERIVKDFIDPEKMNCSQEELADREIQNRTEEIVEKIRRRLTTARELNALSQSLGNLGLVPQLDLKKDETEIEFF